MRREHKQALQARAERALLNLYHNATPRYPRHLEDDQAAVFDSWLEDAAAYGIEYLNSGGAYGRNYNQTLRAPCNAGRYKSERARERYVRKGMRAMREERAKYAAWENIGNYGRLYTWGRGGRTLAPDNLIKMRGGRSFSINTAPAEENSAADLVDLILTLESFNEYVESWCRGVPEMFSEYWQENHVATLDEMAVLSETD